MHARFRCEECGCSFEHPKVVSESRGEFWGFPAYEDTYYCPNCNSDYFEEINESEEEDENEEED